LKVTFSEPIKYTELVDPSTGRVNQKFYLYDDGVLTAALLQDAHIIAGSTDGTQLTMIIPTKAGEITALEDRLQLVSGTSDTAGNIPPDPSVGRKQPIAIVGGNAIEVVVVDNPINLNRPNQLTIDWVQRNLPGVFPADGARGLVVSVKVQKPLEQAQDGSYGEVSIYDAVGNLVQSELKIRKGKDYRTMGVFWDCRNRNGRLVGGGVYLMVLKTRDIDHKEFVNKVKLGVKR
jgi:hypothetical protein